MKKLINSWLKSRKTAHKRPLESLKKTEVASNQVGGAKAPERLSEKLSESQSGNISPALATDIIFHLALENAKEMAKTDFEDKTDGKLLLYEFLKFHSALLVLQIRLLSSESLAHDFFTELSGIMSKKLNDVGFNNLPANFIPAYKQVVYDDYLGEKQGRTFLSWVDKNHKVFQRSDYAHLLPEERVNFKLLFNLSIATGFDREQFPVIDGLEMYTITTTAWIQAVEFWRSAKGFRLNEQANS